MNGRQALAYCLILVAGLGVIGGIMIGSVAAVIVWLLAGGAGAGYLLRIRRRRALAAEAEIAARAERENALYLDGKDEGLYGTWNEAGR